MRNILLDDNRLEEDVVIDEETFKKIMQKAEEDDPINQNIVGNCYYYGNWVNKDYKEAYKWYKKASEKGYAPALSNLGACYYLGNGIKKNYSEAVRCFNLAIEQDFVLAMYNLGVCYQEGYGVPENLKMANKLLSEANKKSQE